MAIHNVYAAMDEGDKSVVDNAMNEVREVLKSHGIPTSNTDPAEHLVEAIAVYIAAGRKEEEQAAIEHWREGWRNVGREDFIAGRPNRSNRETGDLLGKAAVVPYSEGWLGTIAEVVEKAEAKS